VAGVIGRGLADAAARYKAELDGLMPGAPPRPLNPPAAVAAAAEDYRAISGNWLPPM